MTERARSNENAAAWPPPVPTSRSDTAGLVVAVLASEYIVATELAPLSV
jgi:hypothetical protein